MHPIFNTWEIVRCIVREYVSLQQGSATNQRTQERAALALLARVPVFSSHALDLLWRDSGVLHLNSLLGIEGASPGEQELTPRGEEDESMETSSSVGPTPNIT